RRRHTSFSRDWSSDVCSSDLDGTIDLGSVGTSGGPAGFQLIRTADEDLAGFSASSAGDVNGDGIDDLIVGAPASNQAGFSSGARSEERRVGKECRPRWWA